MNILISFGDFYNNLSSDGLLFFWIVLFILCFLIFLMTTLIIKNKKLTMLLKEDNSTNSKKIYEQDIPIADEKEVVKEEKQQVFEINEEIIIEREKQQDLKKDETKKNESGPYKKNVLREMNSRTQTSPISISSKDVIYNENENDNDYNDFDELYLREESISPLEEMEDTYEVNDNMKFASEIVQRMEEEIKPSNIELTDYEKKQEEEAIISYDELLKVKDKIYNITEDEETDEFIDELKSFRLDL